MVKPMDRALYLCKRVELPLPYDYSSILIRRMFRSLIKNLIIEAVTQQDKILTLQPDDTLIVYHGTGGAYLPMVHGIDATREHHRSYGGPRHAGIFVTTDPDEAMRFASYGAVIIEMEVSVKDLYGTNWSGDTGKDQVAGSMPGPNELWRDKYPDSFRPYLTATLLQTSEPQALLKGIVRPDAISRVQYKGTWYTRDELLDMVPEYYKPSERTPTKLQRLSFDPTDGNISLDEFYEIVESEHDIKRFEAERAMEWRAKDPEKLFEMIVSLGWRHNAAKELSALIISGQE